MPTTLQVLSQDSAGVTFADPGKPDLTVRFKHTTSSKSINGVMVSNIRAEVIMNDNNVVNVGGATAVDANSVRLSVSGSIHSKARLSQLLLSLAGQIASWNQENVFLGFRPSSAPVILDT
uniref:Uncharacterized protein n=1 Tax=Fonsystermes virus TaxID=2796590 RepID=A0A7T7K8X1_9VIRU|nr:hypothetical protein [Fonsystermes virus]